MTNRFEIRSLSAADQETIVQVARVLVDAFREQSPNAYPTLDDALVEVQDSLATGRTSLVLVDATGQVIGWVAGECGYDGHAWELHPLAVRPDRQGEGWGRRLVLALEDVARAAGATTLWLGTDDETGLTSLGGVDLYPDPLAHLARLEDRGHPVGFYRRLGYAVVGVLPDANGPGKPDIWMSKRLTAPTTD